MRYDVCTAQWPNHGCFSDYIQMAPRKTRWDTRSYRAKILVRRLLTFIAPILVSGQNVRTPQTVYRHHGIINEVPFITRDSDVIMFLFHVVVCMCVCVCLSRCLFGRFDMWKPGVRQTLYKIAIQNKCTKTARVSIQLPRSIGQKTYPLTITNHCTYPQHYSRPQT